MRTGTRAAWCLLAGILVPAAGGAQPLVIHVTEATTGTPLSGVLVAVEDAGGAQVGRALTNARGRLLFPDVVPGRHIVRAERIGYETGEQSVDITPGEIAHVEIALAIRAIELEGITAEGEGRCQVRPEEGLAVAEVWDEVRKALEATRWTEERGVYEYRTRRYSRNVDRETGRVSDEEVVRGRAYQKTPYVSHPAEDLIENGFVQDTDDTPGGALYFGPDASVLLSDLFLDSHCMRLRAGDGDEAGLVGLAFEPIRDRRVTDIAGTLWVDPEGWRLSHLEYAYVNLRPDVETHGVGGEVVFRFLPDGTWIVPRWRIRMPWLAVGRDGHGRETIYQQGFHEEGATVLSVREPGGEVLFTASTAALDGVVVAAATGRPLAGVPVSLEGWDRSVETDSLGRFLFSDVPEGNYAVTAVTGRNLEDVSVPVELKGGTITPVTLEVPDLFTRHAGPCRQEGDPTPAGSAILMGRVTAPDTDEPLEGVRVAIEWDDPGMERSGEGARGVVATTAADGRYLACAVPTGTLLRVAVLLEDGRTPGDTLRIPTTAPGLIHEMELDPDRRRPPADPAIPPPVAPLEVEGIVATVEARIARLTAAGFYQRKREGLGFFLDAPQIQRRLPTMVTALFDAVPGIRIGFTSATAGGREVVVVRNCLPTIFIDGNLVRKAMPFERNPEPGATPLYLSDLVRASDIAGVEVYRSPAELPPRYGGTGRECGAVLVWTHQ